MTVTTRPLDERTLQDVADGRPLSRAEAIELIEARGPLLPALLGAASRRRRPTRHVTYSRKVFIPLTNLCRDVCGYCTFARSERDPKAHTMTPDEVLAVARAGQAAGCKEALFSLGERPEDRFQSMRATLKRLGYASTTEYLAAMCNLVHRETGLMPHANCGVLERHELEQLAPVNLSMGLMLESASERLLEKGQAHWACPGKVPEVRLRTMRTAAELGVAFTTGILIGIGETAEERVDALLAIRDLHAETANIQEVIVQNFRAKPDTRFRKGPPRPKASPDREEDALGRMAEENRLEPSALDMARTIAVARLLLGPDAHIQAPPNLTPDAYAFYLLAGIDDWGGVSPVTRDHINPEAAWPAIVELEMASADAGFALRERLALYPEFQNPRFLRPAFEARVRALVDEEGLVARPATLSSRAGL
jgi:FO synthase